MVSAGLMYWDKGRGGWVLLGDPAYTRHISDSTNGTMERFKKVWNAGEDFTGQPYCLEICPGCGCELPELKGLSPRKIDCNES